MVERLTFVLTVSSGVEHNTINLSVTSSTPEYSERLLSLKTFRVKNPKLGMQFLGVIDQAEKR